MSEHANLEDARHPDAVERFQHAQKRLGHAYLDAFFALANDPRGIYRGDIADYFTGHYMTPIDVALDLEEYDLAVQIADRVGSQVWYEIILDRHPTQEVATRIVEFAVTTDMMWHNTLRSLANAGFHDEVEEIVSSFPPDENMSPTQWRAYIINQYADLADTKDGKIYGRRARELLEEEKDHLTPYQQASVWKTLAEKTGKDEHIRTLADFTPESVREDINLSALDPQVEAVDTALRYRKGKLAKEIYEETDPEKILGATAAQYAILGVFVNSSMDTKGFEDDVNDLINRYGHGIVSYMLEKHGYIALSFKIARSYTRHYPLENRYAFFQKAAEKHPDGLHVAIDQIPWSIDRDIAICVMAEASIAKSDKDVGMKFLKTLIQTMSNDILRNVTIATLIQSLNRRGLFDASLELIDLASDTYYSDALRNFAEGPTSERVDVIIASANMTSNMTYPHWRTITLRDAYGKHVLGTGVPNMEKFLKENPDFERRR